MAADGFDLPPERAGVTPPAAVVAIREQIAAFAPTWLAGIEPAPLRSPIGGVDCLSIAAPGGPRGTVVHLHGGAFRIGAPEVVAPFAAALAKRCDVGVVCPAYRLAPDHPFPAGLNDGWAVLDHLAATSDGPIILSGDSAGGGLAVSLTLLAVERELPLAGLVLLSPWLDLTVTSADYATNANSDPLFSAAAAREAAGQYLQGIDPAHPLASPLFASLAGLPPTLVVVGEGEVLVGDARRVDAALGAIGIASTLDIVPGMEHVAVVRDSMLTGAAETFAAVAAFVDARLAPHG